MQYLLQGPCTSPPTHSRSLIRLTIMEPHYRFLAFKTGARSFVFWNLIFQITVVCTLSVYISIFAKSERKLIQNPRIDMLDKRNESCANHTFYTGLSGTTFKDNFYGLYIIGYIWQCMMYFHRLRAYLHENFMWIPLKVVPNATGR